MRIRGGVSRLLSKHLSSREICQSPEVRCDSPPLAEACEQSPIASLPFPPALAVALISFLHIEPDFRVLIFIDRILLVDVPRTPMHLQVAFSHLLEASQLQTRRSLSVYLISGAGAAAENARSNVARSALGKSETAT